MTGTSAPTHEANAAQANLTVLNEILTYVSTCDKVVFEHYRDQQLLRHKYVSHLHIDELYLDTRSERRWSRHQVNGTVWEDDKEVKELNGQRLFVSDVLNALKELIIKEYGLDVVSSMGWCDPQDENRCKGFELRG